MSIKLGEGDIPKSVDGDAPGSPIASTDRLTYL